jgi:hypothetical protein
MGHCFLYALTIQVSSYDIDFFGSLRVLMLRVIILKKVRFIAPRRVETANQHIKKNQRTTSYAVNQMRNGFSALNNVCSHEDCTGREPSCDYISHNFLSN